MSTVLRSLALLTGLLGLSSPLLAQGPADPKPGVVIVAGGVGGIDPIGPLARLTLPAAGVRHEVVDFVWTHGTGRWLRDLQDTRYLLGRAEELAERVRRIKETDPERPVYLVGHSGGGGLVLAAAERLPDATLERIILLSAAVSPVYDLRPALRATRREIVSYHSDLDRLILGWGTSQFGTIDRHYCPAAGRVGFTVPADFGEEDRELYARLKQIAWQPEMILRGHNGTHGGTAMPIFLARHVAPWLK